MGALTHKPALLAPDFTSHTPESFAAHVGALKRIPARSSRAPKPPKLPKVKVKLLVASKQFEFQSAKKLHHVAYVETREGRSKIKWVDYAALELATHILLQPLDTLVEVLERKKVKFLGNRPSAQSVKELLETTTPIEKEIENVTL